MPASTKLLYREFGLRMAPVTQESRAARDEPLNSYLTDTERDGDLPLLPAELLPMPGTHAAPLPQVRWVEVLRVHALL